MVSRTNRSSILAILFVFVLIALLFLTPWLKPAPSTGIGVHFIDVGQGLSVLVELPNGNTLLYDAGPYKAKDTIVSYLRSQGVKHIDYLVFSHPDADHIGAGAEVISNFSIGAIYMPKVSNTTKTFENLLKTIQAKHMTIKEAKAGVNITGLTDVTLQFIGPINYDLQTLNNNSAVLVVAYGSFSLLLTGDAEIPELEDIMGAYTVRQITVFQVPHHGARNCLHMSFYEMIKPQYAVISVGKNDYGHPSSEVISALNHVGARVYRTDTNGHVTITSDGDTVRVKASR